jgi:hypothetical protein
MNFEYYFELLQQTEKPTFVFESLESQEVIKLCFQQLENYLIEKVPKSEIKRKILNIVVEMLSSCDKTKHIEKSSFVKFYDRKESYIIYGNIILNNEKAIRVIKIVDAINAYDYYEVAKTYQNLVLKGTDEFEFCIWNIARKSQKNCYFNITNTEKGHFTLEIITVIHKVIA